MNKDSYDLLKEQVTSSDLFIPYFVVYRYKDNSNDHSLYMSGFLTLRQMYAFIGNNIERWSEYSVGRTLEMFSL